MNIVKYYVFIYENGKCNILKLFQEWGKGYKENNEGVNSTMIYFKNFYVTMYPQYNNNII
jgi:hypothetical protein